MTLNNALVLGVLIECFADMIGGFTQSLPFLMKSLGLPFCQEKKETAQAQGQGHRFELLVHVICEILGVENVFRVILSGLDRTTRGRNLDT